MNSRIGIGLTGTAVLLAVVVQVTGRTGELKQLSWLEPKNPTRLEWLALEKQALEGDAEFGDNGVTVHFYLGPDSPRTGVILCDLAYLPSAKAELVQAIEDGILRRFEVQR